MCGGLVADVAASVLTVGTGSAPVVTLAGSSAWAAFGGFSPALAAQSVLLFPTTSLAGDTAAPPEGPSDQPWLHKFPGEQ